MLKINIYMIAKNSNDEYDKISKEFIKMSSKYAKVEAFNLFNKYIAKAQTIGENEAKRSYTETFLPFLDNSYNVALDVKGRAFCSFEFAKLLQTNSNINFFIGGAFGFQKNFLEKCNKIITLSNLTMAHKMVHLVLQEQIFRGLCINNKHPYHK